MRVMINGIIREVTEARPMLKGSQPAVELLDSERRGDRGNSDTIPFCNKKEVEEFMACLLRDGFVPGNYKTRP